MSAQKSEKSQTDVSNALLFREMAERLRRAEAESDKQQRKRLRLEKALEQDSPAWQFEPGVGL